MYLLLAVYNPHVLLRTRLVDRYPSVYVAVFITGCIQSTCFRTRLVDRYPSVYVAVCIYYWLYTIHMFYLGHG